MIWGNLIDFHCMKLYKVIRTSFFIKSINIYHFPGLSINTKDYIYQFNHLWVFNHLKLMVIREVYNQIAIGNLDYQKTISLIT